MEPEGGAWGPGFVPVAGLGWWMPGLWVLSEGIVFIGLESHFFSLFLTVLAVFFWNGNWRKSVDECTVAGADGRGGRAADARETEESRYSVFLFCGLPVGSG